MRFRPVMMGRGIANGFSEIERPRTRPNAPRVEAKDTGDEEAMFYDADPRRAEYGMPPTGGCGIGIDRLVMLPDRQPQHPATSSCSLRRED